MYNVNTAEIESSLMYIETVLPVLQRIAQMEQKEWSNDPMALLAAERAVHVTIESVVDVGNHIIDGFIMRDPGSYVDIIDILQDEQVIPLDTAKAMKVWVGFRRPLVQRFKELEPSELYSVIQHYVDDLPQFGSHVRTYLQREGI